MARTSCSSASGGRRFPVANTRQVPQIPVRQPKRIGAFCRVRLIDSGLVESTVAGGFWVAGKEIVKVGELDVMGISLAPSPTGRGLG